MTGSISDEAGQQTQYSTNQPTNISSFPTTVQYLQPCSNQLVQGSPQFSNVPVVCQAPDPYFCYTPHMSPILTVPAAAVTPVLDAYAAPNCLRIPPPLNLAGYSPFLEPVLISNSPSPVFGPMQNTFFQPTNYSNSPSPVLGTMQNTFFEPINYSNSPSPVFGPITISNSPSPVFGTTQTFFQTTPSRSPSPRRDVLPNQSEFEILYELNIIKHQATVKSILHDYSSLIANAMRNILEDQNLDIYVGAGVQDKSMTLYWNVHPESCDFKTLQKMTQTKDFKDRLICELALIGNGAFNRHLHGSKQLIIIFKGWISFQILKDALVSYNDAKENLLKSHPDDKFDEENVKDLLRVCEAPKGKALRGENVVGGHFRGEDVLRMEEFLEIVTQVIGPIKNATMIPSMKGKAQYKGWSIYVETPSVNHVDTIIEACKTCKFKNAEIFTAFDKFQHEEN